MGHSVSRQTTAAGEKKASKATKVWSAEEAINEVRQLRAGKLFVTNMELVDLLLADDDNLVGQLKENLNVQAAQAEEITSLRADNEKFVARNNELMDVILKLKHDQFHPQPLKIEEADNVPCDAPPFHPDGRPESEQENAQ